MASIPKVCVIEDSTPIRKLFCTLLKKGGMETIDFADGFSSLEWLKENKPDGIIMDILLPDLNGAELITQVKGMEGYSNIPVIAVTGFASAGDRDKYIQMGFDSYIAKPVNTSTFVDEVKEGFKIS